MSDQLIRKIGFSALLVLLVFKTTFVSAQSPANRWGLGFDINYKEYNGDLGNGFVKFSNLTNLMPGLRITRHLNRSCDFGVNFNSGNYVFKNLDSLNLPSLNATVWDVNLNLKYKFNNGYVLKKDALIGPYFLIGFGVINVKNKNLGSDNKERFYNIPIGIGAKIHIASDLFFYMQTTYNIGFNDTYDGKSNIKPGNDRLLNHSMGLCFIFERKVRTMR